MKNKEKLKELLSKLNSLQDKEKLPSDSVDDFIKEEVSNLSSKLSENPSIKILKKFNRDLSQFKKDFDLGPIISLIKDLEGEIKENQKSTITEFENKITQVIEQVRKSIPKIPNPVKPFDPSFLVEEISKVKESILAKKDFDSSSLDTLTKETRAVVDTLSKELEKIKSDETGKKSRKELEEMIEDLRSDLFSKLSNLGGGSMNRQILFNGIDRLTKYTDINLKPGSNVTFTVSEDNDKKRVNLTISATGGGGGSGITRQINSVSSNTAADPTQGIDFVYLVSGNTTITLPDASGNSNLYTIKNVGVGTVIVNTTGGQTIDDSLTITLPVRFTSVDIESDGTLYWNIT